MIEHEIYILYDPSHKSQNASVPYPTMHHFVAEMCTCVHISVTKWCIVGYGTDAFWDLWDGAPFNNRDLPCTKFFSDQVTRNWIKAEMKIPQNLNCDGWKILEKRFPGDTITRSDIRIYSPYNTTITTIGYRSDVEFTKTLHISVTVTGKKSIVYI